jgi:hypothetical protein
MPVFFGLTSGQGGVQVPHLSSWRLAVALTLVDSGPRGLASLLVVAGEL